MENKDHNQLFNIIDEKIDALIDSFQSKKKVKKQETESDTYYKMWQQMTEE